MEHTERAKALENLATAVALLDAQLCVLYLNPAAEALLETSSGRAQGFGLTKLMPHSARFIEDLRAAMRSTHSYTEREMQIALPSNRVLTASCTITPLGEGARPSALLLEITELGRQLRMTREEHLLAQQKTTQAMLRGLAHEIKNPLGGLRGAAQLLETELGDPELREYTRIIIREADRLRKLMDRMLGPSNRPHMALASVHEILEHVRGLIVAEAPDGVRVEQDYDPSIPLIRGDRDLLVQAILNVALNALQAVCDKGVIKFRTRIARQCTIGAKRYRLAVRIDIINDGPGIAPELLEQIFFPMVTGRPQGVGLGLSIAQNLINQHNGIIECNSRPGHTEFCAVLPLENGSTESGK